jgi:hypothetical protein
MRTRSAPREAIIKRNVNVLAVLPPDNRAADRTPHAGLTPTELIEAMMRSAVSFARRGAELSLQITTGAAQQGQEVRPRSSITFVVALAPLGMPG